MTTLTNFPAFTSLKAHRKRLAAVSLRQLFAADKDRFGHFALRFGDLTLDLSKNRIDQAAFDDLLELARQAGLEDHRRRLFAGEAVNNTEGRAALHMALRAPAAHGREHLAFAIGGKSVMEAVEEELQRAYAFANHVCHGAYAGATNKNFDRVINIGIGGSDLGPALAVQALRPYVTSHIAFDFVSNVDGADLDAALAKANPETTLFIIASKTFTTAETMANARSAKAWIEEKLGASAGERHFAAVTANVAEAQAFGIVPDYIFRFWDWVGGRYSLWSVVGLSAIIAIQPSFFRDFLSGAAAMDRHFLETPLGKNLPVMLGLLQIWHRNLWGFSSQAILPYAQDLVGLPAYLQQLEMESNGKSVTREGKPTDYDTTPVIWGAAGTNGQHAFHQLLHQGSEIIPSDFILVAGGKSRFPAQHDMLVANGLAQSAALAFGRSEVEAAQDMRRQGYDAPGIARLAPHRVCPGNRPSSTILLPALDPYHLGALIALYEHKVFVAGSLWNVNSFDQWGVELGKDMARAIMEDAEAHLDSSTAGLKAIYDVFRLRQ